MVSYIKTQWWRLLLALICFVITCYYAFSPAGDSSTVEGLNQDLGNIVSAGINFAGFVIWSFSSFVDYHTLCLHKLNERVEALEKELKEIKK